MTMTIKILGPGCRNYVILDRVTREAVTALALDVDASDRHTQAQITIEGNHP